MFVPDSLDYYKVVLPMFIYTWTGATHVLGSMRKCGAPLALCVGLANSSLVQSWSLVLLGPNPGCSLPIQLFSFSTKSQTFKLHWALSLQWKFFHSQSFQLSPTLQNSLASQSLWNLDSTKFLSPRNSSISLRTKFFLQISHSISLYLHNLILYFLL